MIWIEYSKWLDCWRWLECCLRWPDSADFRPKSAIFSEMPVNGALGNWLQEATQFVATPLLGVSSWSRALNARCFQDSSCLLCFVLSTNLWTIVFCRANNIADVKEVKKLEKLPKLTALVLAGLITCYFHWQWLWVASRKVLPTRILLGSSCSSTQWPLAHGLM